MSKTQEIARLDAILKNLPVESYLYSTLRHIRLQFESDIRSDFETLPDMGEIRLQIDAARALLENLRAVRADVEEQTRLLEARARKALMLTAEAAHHIIQLRNNLTRGCHEVDGILDNSKKEIEKLPK